MFNKFLERILPDVQVRLFVQRWCGYLLTGDTSEQVVALWWGQGANGKSTLAETIKFILSDYAKSIGFRSLIRDDRGRGAEPSPDLARLRGSRAAFASEPEQRVTFSEGLIKSLTGGEAITVRHLHQEFFEFLPKFKLTLAFNNQPKVVGTDYGIWRRMALTPFTVIIPEAERDKALGQKLQAEASGILNWMLDGYRAWRDRGLDIPSAVRVATEEYRSESDPIGQFLNDAAEESADERVRAGVLYAAYQRWCHANAQSVFTATSFGKRVHQRFKKVTSNGVVYLGFKLRPEWLPKALDQDQPINSEAID